MVEVIVRVPLTRSHRHGGTGASGSVGAFWVRPEPARIVVYGTQVFKEKVAGGLGFPATSLSTT